MAAQIGCDPMRLVHMDDFVVRCPRCKQTFSSDNADRLADALVTHVEQEHGHAPPREHVLARIQRQNTASWLRGPGPTSAPTL